MICFSVNENCFLIASIGVRSSHAISIIRLIFSFVSFIWCDAKLFLFFANLKEIIINFRYEDSTKVNFVAK